jgi:hypothetical protein
VPNVGESCLQGFETITEEQFKQIQLLCREWLSDPATNRDSRLTIPAGAVLPQSITIEIKGILTFDDVLITSAVDTKTGVCYTKLIAKSGQTGTFIDSPFEMIVAGEVPQPDKTRSQYPAYASEGVTDEATNLHREERTAFRDESARGEYLLCSNGKVLGSSSLEKTNSANQRTGRFFPSDDYFEVAEIFGQFPTAENDWLEANVREAYGLTDENASDFRKKFNELCERIDALKLYVADKSGKQIATIEVKLEDLSTFYGDESERWLHVDFGK